MNADTQNFTFDILYDHGGITMTFVEWADGFKNYEVHRWDEDAQEWTFIAEAVDPSTFDASKIGGRPRLVARTHFRKIV